MQYTTANCLREFVIYGTRVHVIGLPSSPGHTWIGLKVSVRYHGTSSLGIRAPADVVPCSAFNDLVTVNTSRLKRVELREY